MAYYPNKNELLATLREKSAANVKQDRTYLTRLGIDTKSYEQYQELDYLTTQLTARRSEKIYDFKKVLIQNQQSVRSFIDRLGGLRDEGYGLPVLLSSLRRKAQKESLNLDRDNRFLAKQLRLIDDNFRLIEQSRTRVETPLLRPLIMGAAEDSIKNYSAGTAVIKDQWKSLYEQFGIPLEKLPYQYK